MKGIHKYKLSLIPLGLVAITLLSGYFLSHVTLGAHADTNKTSTVSVRVADTCSMTGEVTAEHSASLINGQSKTGIGTTELTTMCNDNNGYAIYAVGYGFLNSADMNSGTGTMGVTDLLGATSGLKISTANWADRNTGDNASKSIWSMALLPWDGTSDPTRPVSNNPTIVNGYDSYMAVPSTYTKVASFPSSTITETATKSVVKTSYAAKIADIQTADTYVGQVKYTMVHPSSNTATGFTFDDAFQLAGKSRVSGTSYFAMQDMNAAICNKVTELNNDFPETQLIDTRDNNIYTIKKINGDCWMTQNLRFTGTTLTPADSNVSANTTMAYYSLDANDASYTDHCDDTNGYNYACIKDSGNDIAGVWYNYAAASAGTITTNDNTTASNYSVCPKGWKMPSGPANDASSDFYSLYNSLSTQDVLNQYLIAFNAVDGGFYRYANGIIYHTNVGIYWSTNPATTTTAYALQYVNDQPNIFLTDDAGVYRYAGVYVRCLANDSMQNFDQDAASSLAINESLQLRDERDGKEYWVTKLADGNVWMTQNLDLDLDSTVALTNADTDLHSVTSWTPTRSTINASGNTMNTYPTDTVGWATDGTNSWSSDNYTPYSVDAGYKYILPIEKTTADGSAWNSTPYDTVYNSLAECQAAASDSSKNSFGLACDGHTSVGNYYNFAAANATNNITSTLTSIGKEDVQNVDLPDSICPAGWRLPKDNSDNSKNEFAILLGNNNFNSGYNVYSSFNPNGLNAIRQAPLYFVRSGRVNGGALGNVGMLSGTWSSTISNTASGYYLTFHSSDIVPANSDSRALGFPIRCLLRTE